MTSLGFPMARTEAAQWLSYAECDNIVTGGKMARDEQFRRLLATGVKDATTPATATAH